MNKTHKLSIALSALALVAFPGPAMADGDKCDNKKNEGNRG